MKQRTINTRSIGFTLLMLLALGAIGWVAAYQLRAARSVGSTAQPSDDVVLSDYGIAPELLGSAWLNTDQPIRLRDLRGQVVLLQFWTFGCINCQRTLPYMQAWYTEYGEQGLAVIGNHYPEYSYEREILNVAGALETRGVTYPIVQDNTGATWSAYGQRYWPTMYLIDKAGHIRYVSFGEGNYEGIESGIHALLAEVYADDGVPGLPVQDYVTPLQRVSVYLDPSQDSQIIGSIAENMAFVVHDVNDGWYHISYNDRDGYIAADAGQVRFTTGSARN